MKGSREANVRESRGREGNESQGTVKSKAALKTSDILHFKGFCDIWKVSDRGGREQLSRLRTQERDRGGSERASAVTGRWWAEVDREAKTFSGGGPQHGRPEAGGHPGLPRVCECRP